LTSRNPGSYQAHAQVPLGEAAPLTEYSMAQSLLRWQTALHEWLGLAVYGWTR
jgi:hypothetical protein